jgi:hypothetical protein
MWKYLLHTVGTPDVGKQSIHFTGIQGTEIDIPAYQYTVFNVLPDPNFIQTTDILDPELTTKTRLDLSVSFRRHEEGKGKRASFASYCC